MVRIIVYLLNDLLSLICADRLYFVFGILGRIQRSPMIRPSIFHLGWEEDSTGLASCRCMLLIFGIQSSQLRISCSAPSSRTRNNSLSLFDTYFCILGGPVMVVRDALQ